MSKEIWSDRYGTKQTITEGLHKYLTRRFPEYKRSQLQKYLKGFAAYIGQPNKMDNPKLVSEHFGKWIKFLNTTNQPPSQG